LSVVFEQSRREWGLAVINPIKQIRMPKPGKPRQRRLRAGEEDALLSACRTSCAYYLESFVIPAIETGMRFGELAGVRSEHVSLSNRTIHLPDTKNVYSRTVPLSIRALEPASADGAQRHPYPPRQSGVMNVVPYRLDPALQALRQPRAHPDRRRRGFGQNACSGCSGHRAHPARPG
jgi:integrase